MSSHLKLICLDENDIRGNQITVVEGDDISGHKLAGVYHANLAVTGDVCLLRDKLLEPWRRKNKRCSEDTQTVPQICFPKIMIKSVATRQVAKETPQGTASAHPP